MDQFECVLKPSPMMPSKSDPHIYRRESASETEVREISELFTRQEFKKGKMQTFKNKTKQNGALNEEMDS